MLVTCKQWVCVGEGRGRRCEESVVLLVKRGWSPKRSVGWKGGGLFLMPLDSQRWLE